MLLKNIVKQEQFTIPPKTKLFYEDFKLVAETSTYRVFNARARASSEWHTVRVLDCKKEYVEANNDHAATLFVQELLWLQQSYPGSVFTDTFEISGNGKQMACATLPYRPLSCQLSGSENVINPNDSKVIEKLLSDVLSDVKFLRKDLHLENILDSLGPENISFIKEKNRFFLGNWAKIYEAAQFEALNVSTATTYAAEPAKNKMLSPQDLAEEMKALACAILKINNLDYTALETLQAIPNLETSVYNFAVQSLLTKCFPDSEKLRSLIGKMLSPDFRNLPNLEELIVKEDKPQPSSNPVKEESKQLQGETQSRTLNKSSTIMSIIHPIFIIFRPNH